MAGSWQDDAEAPLAAVEGASPSDPEDPLPEPQAVVDLARKVMADAAVQRWMRTPNSGLDGARPMDLVATGGHRHVVDLLLAVAEGVTV